MLEIVFVVIEVLLLLANSFWEQLKVFKDEQSAFQWFVISQFSLLVLLIAATSNSVKRHFKSAKTDLNQQILQLSSRLSHNTITLRQDAFYSDFREEIARAQFSVDITHLDTRAPHDAALPRSAMRNYYDEFASILRSRPQVRFRRVERVSLGKRGWIESLAEEMTGRINCSLGCLIMADTARKLPAISVQLIDNRKCYLVAIREHVEAHAPRDISITDREATAMWLGYYNEMLWGKAIKVVENGVLNQLGLDAVRAHLDQLEASPQ